MMSHQDFPIDYEGLLLSRGCEMCIQRKVPEDLWLDKLKKTDDSSITVQPLFILGSLSCCLQFRESLIFPAANFLFLEVTHEPPIIRDPKVETEGTTPEWL